jgi:hypothetical protein
LPPMVAPASIPEHHRNRYDFIVSHLARLRDEIGLVPRGPVYERIAEAADDFGIEETVRALLQPYRYRLTLRTARCTPSTPTMCGCS